MTISGAADLKTRKLLVCVGSRHDQICSIGAFARKEAEALKSIFGKVELLEPGSNGNYPSREGVSSIPDYIFFHAPALHDRKKPWYAIRNILLLKLAFPKAKIISIVHEFCEAPIHWKLRQIVLLKLSHAVVVNCEPDFLGLKKYTSKILRSNLGPTLWNEALINENFALKHDEIYKKNREKLSSHLSIPNTEMWVVSPGLITQGKGAGFLKQLKKLANDNVRLIVMGGQGPKSRDKAFSESIERELTEVFKSKFTLISSPNDEVFANMLNAADLVLLPYDQGLSERRSSFLSALSCGANVWTSVGDYSAPTNYKKSGTYFFPSKELTTNFHAVESSIYEALSGGFEKSVERRIKNIEWARDKAWSFRCDRIASFLSGL